MGLMGVTLFEVHRQKKASKRAITWQAAKALSCWKLQKNKETGESEGWSTRPRTLQGARAGGQAFTQGFSTPQRAGLSVRQGESPGEGPTSLTTAESGLQKSRHRWVRTESGLM